ncbi:S8 family serine peptidase [Actinokineospora globicatena]|uniref:Peptidase S8/S53 domain-containing protein n=1 Tax=Actinokineospora globicatena TaxID=103729 RepID=A0A9W6VA30_9PSEU|nr:S8 family serine peptidase [Actinokineospora globicatena]GLW91641.1 hypothetical protein Aglo03_24570 [Actinokineospora globicatena]
MVAVIDTGVNAAELAGAALPGRSFPDLGTDVHDENGHGTRMARVVLAAAPGAKVLPVKVAGGADVLADAITWATANGAQVINVSQGAKRRSDRLVAAVRAAIERGVIVVAAAGNVAQDTRVPAPADLDGVLAISAVDADGRFRPDISVSGPEVDLAAPGVGIAVSPEDKPASGTSYAAAITSGVVALVRARYPDLTGEEVVRKLTGTARDAGPPGPDPEYGAGIVDPVAATAEEPSTVASWVLSLGVLAVGAAAASGGLVWWRRRRSQRS